MSEAIASKKLPITPLRRRRRTILATIGLLAFGLASAGPVGAAQAKPLPPVTTYKVVNISYYQNEPNPGLPVGSCTNKGGNCTITIGDAVSTTISTTFTFSKAGVAAGVGFNINRTTTTTVGCTTPAPLKTGQKFVAYRLGRQAMYKIKKTVTSGTTSTSTYSGWLFSWEPYTGVHVDCYVVG